MDNLEFMPLGSIVLLKGGVKKVVIIARGLSVKFAGTDRLFDYGGCLYPEGLTGDQVLYFNHADIARTVFTGFTDDDETVMVSNINEWLAKTNLPRANAAEIADARGGVLQG